MEYDNLALIRAFENGSDMTISEAGFVLVHVDMVQHSGGLVSGACDAIGGAGGGDREMFNDGLRGMHAAMRIINKTMDSKPPHLPIPPSPLKQC